MNYALFGKNVSEPDGIQHLQNLVSKLEAVDGNLFVYQPFHAMIREKIRFSRDPVLFSAQQEISGKVSFLFSIGGDGTLLDSVILVGDSGIPIIGINTGRLGFLSSISKEDILPVIDEFLREQFRIEPRSLLSVKSENDLFSPFSYALNELTVQKSERTSLLMIQTWINDEFLNTYWADGLIVATPTGSTAYSLSCTGPIITPDSCNFVITPIASHNLTVRPIVIPDEAVIRIKVEARNEFYVSLDSRIVKVQNQANLEIRKAGFRINLIRMMNKNFFKTMREKLNWGLDLRN